MKYALLIVLVLASCTSTTIPDIPETPDELPRITGEECTQRGGTIINTLDSECPEGTTAAYEVTGLRCPCVCCI